MSVTETVRESGSSAFYLSKDTFDAVAISVTFVAEIEPVTGAGVFQRCRAVDENHGVVDVVFLAQLREERVRQDIRSGWFELRMQQFVGFRGDGGVQPVPLIVQSDHGLVDRDVIRPPTSL